MKKSDCYKRAILAIARQWSEDVMFYDQDLLDILPILFECLQDAIRYESQHPEEAADAVS